jgi:hypothetical protein
MGIGTWFGSVFGSGASVQGAGQGGLTDHPSVNPATGLPMTGGIDVLGNPFGVDLNPPHRWDHGSGMSSIGIADIMTPISVYDPNRGWYDAAK